MSPADFFFKINSRKKNSGTQSKCKNNVHPEKAMHIVVPDLVPNCLPKGYQQTTLVGKDLSVNSTAWTHAQSNQDSSLYESRNNMSKAPYKTLRVHRETF